MGVDAETSLSWDNSEACSSLSPRRCQQDCTRVAHTPFKIFFPFPDSLPHCPTTAASWNHLQNKLLTVIFPCHVKDCLGKIQAKTLYTCKADISSGFATWVNKEVLYITLTCCLFFFFFQRIPLVSKQFAKYADRQLATTGQGLHDIRARFCSPSSHGACQKMETDWRLAPKSWSSLVFRGKCTWLTTGQKIISILKTIC